MKDFFETVYELFAGNPDPAADKPIYRDYIFPNVGTLTIIILVVLVVIYYLVINRLYFNKFLSSVGGWWLFLILGGIAYFSLALYIAITQGATQNAYMYWFAGENLFYGCAFFFFLSLLGKLGSTYASKIPF